MLAAMVQELCARAALDDTLSEPASSTLLEALVGMVDAARSLLDPNSTLPIDQFPGPDNGSVSEAALGRSFLSRVLCYALDAAYQMPVHQLSWAKRLLPPLHKLATTESLLDISSRGAQKLVLRNERGGTTQQGGGGPLDALDRGRSSSQLLSPGERSSNTIENAPSSDTTLPSTLLLESAHPLPSEPPAFVGHVHIPNATHIYASRSIIDARHTPRMYYAYNSPRRPCLTAGRSSARSPRLRVWPAAKAMAARLEAAVLVTQVVRIVP